MKDSIKKKLLAGTMAAVLGGASMAGVYGYQKNAPADVKAAEETEILEKAAGEAIGTEEKAGQSSGLTKEESVYVKADPSGNVTKTTVTEWLKNPAAGTVEDISGLRNITNVKGEETFSQDENGKLVWKSEGKDIYYQGETDGELPVGVQVSYKLDGKNVSAQELQGKSGRVEIDINYINRSKQTVDVGGETAEMYTPFTMVTAMLLSTDEYTNVKVDHGRVISDGDKNIVIGVGMPGMQENLKLDGADIGIDIPDSVKITADVKNAGIGSTVTMASADTLSAFHLDEVGNFDELGNSLNELENAAEKLVDGSNAAADGAGELAAGAKTLAAGTSELRQGSGKLADGSRSVTDGIGILSSKGGELVSGVNTLAAGVSTYTGGVGELAEGSARLKAGADSLKTGMDALNNAVKDQNLEENISGLAAGAGQIKAGLGDVSGGLDGIIAMLKQEAQAADGAGADSVSLSDSQRNRIKSEAVSGVSVSVDVPENVPEEYRDAVRAAMEQAAREAAQNAVSNAADTIIRETCSAAGENAAASVQAADAGTLQQAIGGLEAIKNNLSENADLGGGVKQVADGLAKLDAGMKGENGLVASIQKLADGAGEVSVGAAGLAEGVQKLDGGSGQLITGFDQLKKGAAQLPGGMKQLADGSRAVTDGAALLYGSVGELEKGAESLANGADALAEGNQTLAAGMSEFKKEGIDKIAKLFNGNFREIKNRIEAMTQAGRDYRSYAGIREGMEGSTKFIIETEGISE